MMIFQHTYKNVLAGWVEAHPNAPETVELLQILPQLETVKPKTQTRRIENSNHSAMSMNSFFIYDSFETVMSGNRAVYNVGSSYAVQPGRGKKSIARIEITAIRSEDVRDISHEDAIAEGFDSGEGFLATWVSMHDKAVKVTETNYGVVFSEKLHTRNASAFFSDGLKTRPAERYQAWALTFRVAVINIANIREMLITSNSMELESEAA